MWVTVCVWLCPLIWTRSFLGPVTRWPNCGTSETANANRHSRATPATSMPLLWVQGPGMWFILEQIIVKLTLVVLHDILLSSILILVYTVGIIENINFKSAKQRSENLPIVRTTGDSIVILFFLLLFFLKGISVEMTTESNLKNQILGCGTEKYHKDKHKTP